MFPKAGGEYVFLREGLGNLMGFLSGWISLIVGFSAPVAASSIAFSGYFFRALPVNIIDDPSASFFNAGILSISPLTLLACTVIIIFSLIHCYSLNFGCSVQNVLTVFNLLVMFVFITAGYCLGNGSIDHFKSGEETFSIVLSERFAVSLIFISFAYAGWNASTYVGGEIKNPSRYIPLSVFLGVFFVSGLYILMNILYIYSLPADQMSGVLEVGTNAAIALFGVQAGKVFSLAIALCLLSVISVMIMVGPRVYYAMAKNGVFFKSFDRVTKNRRTPAYAICLQAGIAMSMVITASYDKLLLYIGFTLSLFTTLTVTGMLLLRIQKPFLKRPYKTFGYPITPALFITGNLWIIFFCVKSTPATALYGLTTITIGIVWYLFFIFKNKYRKKAC